MKPRATASARTSSDGARLLEPPPDQIPRTDIDVFASQSRMMEHITNLNKLYHVSIRNEFGGVYKGTIDSTEAGHFLDGVNALIELSSELSNERAVRSESKYITQKNQLYAARLKEWAVGLYAAVLNSLERRRYGAKVEETLSETFRFFCVIAHRHTLGFDAPIVKTSGVANDTLPAMPLFQLSSLYSFIGEPELAQCCKFLAVQIYDCLPAKLPITLQVAGVFLQSLRRASDEAPDMEGLKSRLGEEFKQTPLNAEVLHWSAGNYDISRIVEDTLRKRDPTDTARWYRDAPISGFVHKIADTVISYTASSLALLNTTSSIEMNVIGEIMSYRFLTDSTDWWHVAAFIVSHAEACSFVFDRIRPGNAPYYPSNPELAGRICKCSRLLIDTAPKGNDGVDAILTALEDCAAVSITLLRYMCILDYSPSLKESGDATFGLALSGAGEYTVLSFSVNTLSASDALTINIEVSRESALDLQILKGTTNVMRSTDGRAHNQWMAAAMLEDCLFIAAWMYRTEHLSAVSTVRVIIRGSDASTRVMSRIAGNVSEKSGISFDKGVKFPDRHGHASNGAGEREHTKNCSGPDPEWSKLRDSANNSVARCLFFLYVLRITDAQSVWCSRLGCLVQMMNIISSCQSTNECVVNYARRRFIFLACSSIRILEHIFLRHHHYVEATLVDTDRVAFGVLSLGAQIASDTLDRLREALNLASARISTTEGILMHRMWLVNTNEKWAVWSSLKLKLDYRKPIIRNYDELFKILTSTKHLSQIAGLDHDNVHGAYGCVYDKAHAHAPTAVRREFIVENPYDVARRALADSSAFGIL